jgi:hypothetical protein
MFGAIFLFKMLTLSVGATSGMTQEGGSQLQQFLGTRVFAYQKPLSLV